MLLLQETGPAGEESSESAALALLADLQACATLETRQNTLRTLPQLVAKDQAENLPITPFAPLPISALVPKARVRSPSLEQQYVVLPASLLSKPLGTHPMRLHSRQDKFFKIICAEKLCKSY